MKLEEIKNINVILIFSERISSDPTHFEPSVVKEIRQSIRYRYVTRKKRHEEPSVLVTIRSHRVTYDREESVTVNGDSHGLDKRYRNVLGRKFQDTTAIFLQ